MWRGMASEENSLGEAVELFLGRAGATFFLAGGWRLWFMCVFWVGSGSGRGHEEMERNRIIPRRKKQQHGNWELGGNSKSLICSD